MKRKVYDTSLTDSIRQRTALYDAYQAPKANVEEYFHTMENPRYEGAPDDLELQIGYLMHLMIGTLKEMKLLEIVHQVIM